MNDLRYALRQLLKNPGYTVVVLFTLALGIGANTTVFGWIEKVLLQPLPGVARPEEILTLETRTASGELINTSYPDYRDYRDQARLLDGVAVFKELPLALGEEQETVRVWSEFVSGNFFDVLGVRPELGRFFLPEEQEEKPGAEPVVVISHTLWKNRFRGDPGIIGKTIRLNQREFTVIGVAPGAFKGTITGLYFDLWVPVMMQEQLTHGDDWLESRSDRPLHTLVRLRPGVGISQAQAELDQLSRHLAHAYPKTNAGIGATLRRLWDAPYGAQSLLVKPLLLLIAASGMLLLIICANIANLALARATGRRQEIALRLALGAGRGRIIRQLMVESGLLAFLGGVVGLMACAWLGGLLDAFVPKTNLPVALGFVLGGRQFVFAFGCALATAVLFGLAPAWQATQPDLQETLREGGRGGVGDRRSNRLRASLVVAEVALAFVALTGAGLCLRSFQHARKVNPGFDPEGVLLVGLNLASSGYDRAQGLEFYPRLCERLGALPGVQSASYSERVPLGFEGGSWEEIEVPGYVPKLTDNMKVYDNVVAPGYFDLLRIPLLSGRDFTPHDDQRTFGVAIVNETFARRFLPGSLAVGRHFKVHGEDVTIVGVAGDGKYRNLTEGAQPYYYRPFLQSYSANSGVAIHLRASVGAKALLAAVRREVGALDPRVTVFDAMPMTEFIGAALFTQKLAASLLSVLAGLALLMAAIGLYGVMAYGVAQRRREIGLRMALGAGREDVLGMILRDGMKLVAAGLLAGLSGAFLATSVLGHLLLDVNPSDPPTLLAILLLLCAVAFLACWLPAFRATRVEPMVALRDE